jgi:integrase
MSNNFRSAGNRLIAMAVERGFISERVPVPMLTSLGKKGQACPVFTEDEVAHLLDYIASWRRHCLTSVEHGMRPLLRDYVEILLYTGMRHGTEAMGICRRHIEWHTDRISGAKWKFTL